MYFLYGNKVPKSRQRGNFDFPSLETPIKRPEIPSGLRYHNYCAYEVVRMEINKFELLTHDMERTLT